MNVYTAFHHLVQVTVTGEQTRVLLSSPFRNIFLKQLAPDLIDILSQLIIMCTESDDADPLVREGVARSQYQNLLQQQGAVKLLHQLSCAPFKSRNEGGIQLPLWAVERPGLIDPYLKICQLGFRLMKQMSRQNIGIKSVVSQYRPDLTLLLGGQMKVANTLREVYDDNRPLLLAVSDQLILDIVHLMHDNPFPRFLEFLSVFCECNDDPIPHNQNRIARYVLQDNFFILFPC